MSTFDPGSESRGWPFADCAIHVQFRGEDNRRFSVDDIRQTCDDFGRIIKVYVWTAKRSQKPQACVLFDSMEAVKAAERSTHSGMYRLWKNGYHLLRMCESTTMILETCLKKDGLIQGHPIFASIPTRRAFYQVHPPVRGPKPVEKVHRPIPTGPRYQPYSLDARAHPPHSPPRAIPPEASFVSFPPKREATSPNGPAVPRHVKPALFSPRQPNHSSVPPAATQAAPSSPSKPFPRPKTPEPVGPSQTSQVEEVEQTQVKPKLKPEIQNSVSTQIESMTAKMQETEAENQRLKARLRNSEEDLALLEDTVKRVEGREQAAIALLTETETRSQEQLQSLRDSFKAVQSVKVKTEAELEALKRKYGVLEAQLLSTQEQLRLFSLSKRSDDRSIRAHSDSPRPGPETDKASSAEHDDDCITPATAAEFVRNPGSAKGTLQNLAGLLDAFKEIDDLVRSAFHE